jgi:Lrp/AsnC family transcriptional regulator, leucine-responsive regulatory protein
MKDESLVDDIDLKILLSLKMNSRASFADLGREINLSPSATRERVQKMEENKIITKYDIQLDYKLLGYDIEAFILVKVFHGNLKPFLDFVDKLKEVKEAHRIIGNQNVHLKVILKDQLHLQNLIDGLMQYGDTNTFLILSKISTNDF